MIGSSSFEQTGTVSFTNEFYAGAMKAAHELGGKSEPDEPYGNDENGGVGVAFTARDCTMTVTAVLPGTPAASADIRPGDIIGAVDGEPTQGMAPTEFRDIMRGPLKSVVRRNSSARKPTAARSRHRPRHYPVAGTEQSFRRNRLPPVRRLGSIADRAEHRRRICALLGKGRLSRRSTGDSGGRDHRRLVLTGDYSVTADYDVGGRNLTSHATIDAAIRLFRDDPPSRPREWSFPSQLQLTRASELTVDERMQAEQQRRLVTSSNIIFQPAEKRIVLGENAAQWRIRGADKHG